MSADKKPVSHYAQTALDKVTAKPQAEFPFVAFHEDFSETFSVLVDVLAIHSMGLEDFRLNYQPNGSNAATWKAGAMPAPLAEFARDFPNRLDKMHEFLERVYKKQTGS